MRQHVLHVALNRVERGILRLCCRLGLQARGAALRLALESIFRKASLWLSPSFTTRALTAGFPLAVSASRAASMMGNSGARSWVEDREYILLLGVNSLDGRR
ncbi:MAG TPA: hypothetical protein VMS77_09930 [Conexivisphaerales archaeon]|nr:hypothetical protein [Conexivisphaerales archaeon]